jgi:hypothetical protein
MPSPYPPYNALHVLVVTVIDILVPSYDAIWVQFNAHRPTGGSRRRPPHVTADFLIWKSATRAARSHQTLPTLFVGQWRARPIVRRDKAGRGARYKNLDGCLGIPHPLFFSPPPHISHTLTSHSPSSRRADALSGFE